MQLDRMRSVDRWLGGSLVSFVSRFSRDRRDQLSGFGPNGVDPAAQMGQQVAKPGRPFTIAVSKYWGMGSIILTVPMLRALRASFPEARVLFVTFKTNQPLLRFLPYVDQVIAIGNSQTFASFAIDTIKALAVLHHSRIDMFFDLEFFSRYSALVSLYSMPRQRIGFHTSSLRQRSRLLTHKVHWNAYRHACDNFLALAEAAGVPAVDRALELLPLSGSEADHGHHQMQGWGLKTRGYVVCSPVADTLRSLKSYPAELWLEVAERFHRETGLDIVFIGPEKDARWQARGSAAAGYHHNLTGETPFPLLLYIVQNAACLLSVDNGIAHLASVFGVPSLTLFGPETPTLYSPLNPRGRTLYAGLHCSPCANLLEGKQSDCRNNVCIRSWPPERICREALDVLSDTGP